MIVVKERNKLKAMAAFEEYPKWKRELVQSNGKVKHIAARKCIRPILRLLLFGQRKICSFQVEVLNRNRARISRRYLLIFAVTHIGKWDFEIVNEKIPSHFPVMASDDIVFKTVAKSGSSFFDGRFLQRAFVDFKDRNGYICNQLLLSGRCIREDAG